MKAFNIFSVRSESPPETLNSILFILDLVILGKIKN